MYSKGTLMGWPEQFKRIDQKIKISCLITNDKEPCQNASKSMALWRKWFLEEFLSLKASIKWL